MERLTRLNKYLIFFLVLIFILSIAIIIFICFYKIEKTKMIKLQINDFKNQKLLGSQELINEVNVNDFIRLKLQSQIYNVKIKNIQLINNYVEITFYDFPNNWKILNNLEIDGWIILDKISIFKALFNF
ncbi:MAG1140 family protein [Mycoplasma sp. 1018B]|uniref:MAG1140 family protein n=1 Tax=Mycoplasma sp. 1018B TaxID=2967302 RepID=UPI00211BC957|nr:hypothetical protein [Mycoplasma sp. 1018B]UUM19228.1 hypothetical protein NPA14_02780 [Mycoplasma sp. 1018B]